MDVESKLDEDFLFYLGFTRSYSQKVKQCDLPRVKQWLQKLCGELCTTVSQKRNRNIFLSNLLLNIQDGKLSGPFLLDPDAVTYDQAPRFFPALATEIKVPNWVHEIVDNPELDNEPPEEADGQTYVATRALPGGQGAFAYVAISMDEEPDAWIGGAPGMFEQALEEKFKQFVPPIDEMEAILERRKDPVERQRVITFYDVLLQNIADEMDGKIKPEDNQDVNGLMEQLINDLRRKGEFDEYANLEPPVQRFELLLKLHDLADIRRRKTKQVEEVLDTIGAELGSSFFQASDVGEEEKYEMPSAMWEHCINRPPDKKVLETLREKYPAFVVKKFLECLAEQKENIAFRMHRRHVNTISRMKKEMKSESSQMKKRLDEIQGDVDHLEKVHAAVKKAYEAQLESKEKVNAKPKGGETEMTNLYEQMKANLLSAHYAVEEEAKEGHFLAQQINILNEESKTYEEISKQTIEGTEKENMDVMKRIMKLNQAIKMQEMRMRQIQMMHARKDGSSSKKQELLIF